MITCSLPGEWLQKGWVISIPYEVNNQFLGNVHRASSSVATSGLNNKIINKILMPFGCMLTKKMPYNILVALNDFGDVVISPEKLDEYIGYYKLLKEHLDEIIKIIPLPKTIGDFDGGYEKGYCGTIDIDNSIDGTKDFTKEDMNLIIDLIIKKAEQAKQANSKLCFYGD